MAILPLHALLGGFCLLCLIPLLLVAAISLTPESLLKSGGYTLFPKAWSTAAYEYTFRNYAQIVRSYGITISVTAVGAVMGLFCTTSIAYVISRPYFRYRRFLSFFIFFTMLFYGGLTPTYLLVTKTLHLKDSLLALILPSVMQGWYVILMKGFLQSLPNSIVESAKIDGARELSIFARIVVPISRPGMITVGLFLMLQYWNDWYSSLLYIDDQNLVSLQFLLYKLMASIEFFKVMAQMAPGSIRIDPLSIPTLGARMAMCIVAAGPMVLIFVFMQKYFVRGITIGSIKG
ncbi:MAG: carbohydrate ABC transporter permease [Clostridiales bacterium]|nr:carbohydrate ABC transporter permease [Clostridiales bacterium]